MMFDFLIKATYHVCAVLVATAIGIGLYHPLVWELWAGPIRLNLVYPSTMEGQTMAVRNIPDAAHAIIMVLAIVIAGALWAAWPYGMVGSLPDEVQDEASYGRD